MSPAYLFTQAQGGLEYYIMMLSFLLVEFTSNKKNDINAGNFPKKENLQYPNYKISKNL